MIKEKFEEIAAQLGCHYDYEEEFIKSLGGSNIPISHHRMTIEYKSVLIKLIYEFGNTNLAEVKCTIETRKNLPLLSLSTKSQMKRLFSKNKSPFIVKCKDPMFESYVRSTLDLSYYHSLARETSFEPELNGVKEQGNYNLTTIFYLGFDNKEMSILPSIDLHKKIIDYL